MTRSKSVILGVWLALVACAAMAQAPGRPMTWGRGDNGQLGSGLLTDRLTAAPTLRLPPIAAVATGGVHVLFLTTDGRVLAAGDDTYGELGNGPASTSPSPTPEPVPGITTAVAVAAGTHHSLAVLADGTVRAWGYNGNGQLGDGTTEDRHAPITASGITNAVDVAAAFNHSLAVLGNGRAMGWGRNSEGQAGVGTWSHCLTPTLVSGLTNVATVAAGAYHSLAVLTDGSVFSWGFNGYGQLGIGTHLGANTPAPVGGIAPAVDVAAGSFHSVIALSNGTVVACGMNSDGQLGDGTKTERASPVAAVGLSSVLSVAAGYAHSAARLTGGAVATWGSDTNGALGNGSAGATLTPAVLPGLTGIAALTSHEWQCHALTSEGDVYGWGLANAHRLGDSSNSQARVSPTLISALDSATDVAFGYYHALAIRRDGALFAWGYNGYGALGDGSLDSAYAPRKIEGLPPIAGIAAGELHSVTLCSDGTIRAFGSGGNGQLGNGLTVDSGVPVVVTGVSAATEVATGRQTSYALLADGSVLSWGLNSSGELGNGSAAANSPTPVAVSGLAGVRAIAAGGSHAMALLSDGTVRAWGYNAWGQLGDGTYTNSNVPTQVAGLTDVVAIAVGGTHSLAVLADGTVRAWGWNGYGQLGDGSTTHSPTPVPVTGLSGVTAIAAGTGTSMALLSDGTVRAWGYNGQGQIGDGTTTGRLTPVAVPGLSLVTSITVGDTASAALSEQRQTALSVPDKAGEHGAGITLGAVLLASTEPVPGRTVIFTVDGSAVGSASTDGTGIAGLPYTVADALTVGSHSLGATFTGDENYQGSTGSGTLAVTLGTTSLYTVNRSGLVTTPVALKAYLKRTSDSAWLGGRSVEFSVAGTGVGSATTSAAGEAVLTYVIATPAGSHTIGASYAGDADHKPSTGSGTLTATTTNTKVYVVDRTAKVKTYTVLKSYLYTPTNAIIPGQPMVIKLDGTILASGNTHPSGYLQVGYTVAEGAGVGVRTIRGEFPGDGGYMASANTGKLTVTAGDLYIWPYVRTGKKGTNHLLKAYVRSLPDYVIQPGKAIAFKVNGSEVGTGAVGSDGWASATWAIPAGEPTGAHTAAAEFAGDAWYKAVTANAPFNVVP